MRLSEAEAANKTNLENKSRRRTYNYPRDVIQVRIRCDYRAPERG